MESPAENPTSRQRRNPVIRRVKVWRRNAKRNALFLPGLAIATGIFVVDQVTKHLVLANETLGGELCSPQAPRFCGHIDISSIFDLTMVWNKGVSFGLFAGGMGPRVFFSLLSIAVACGLLIWLTSLSRRIPAIGVGLIIGGALGNAYDRIVYGAVVDFLDFSGLYFPYVFNVADAAVNIGVACLAWDAFFGNDSKRSSRGSD